MKTSPKNNEFSSPKSLENFGSFLLSRLDDKRDKAAESFLENLNFKQDLIKKYRDSYPQDEDLFEICFGQKPKDKIEIVAGDITLHIRCYDVNDYIFAYSYGRVHGETDKLSNEKIDWYKKTAAAALYDVAIKELSDGCITIENVQRNLEVSKPKKNETTEEIESRKIEYSERARIHEEQHQLNRLFIPKENGADAKILTALRDEILALYRGGRNKADKIYQDLTQPSGVYDYYFQNQFDKSLSNGKENFKKYLSAITTLEQKGYSSNETLALLFWLPVTGWEQKAIEMPEKYSESPRVV